MSWPRLFHVGLRNEHHDKIRLLLERLVKSLRQVLSPEPHSFKIVAEHRYPPRGEMLSYFFNISSLFPSK